MPHRLRLVWLLDLFGGSDNVTVTGTPGMGTLETCSGRGHITAEKLLFVV